MQALLLLILLAPSLAFAQSVTADFGQASIQGSPLVFGGSYIRPRWTPNIWKTFVDAGINTFYQEEVNDAWTANARAAGATWCGYLQRLPDGTKAPEPADTASWINIKDKMMEKLGTTAAGFDYIALMNEPDLPGYHYLDTRGTSYETTAKGDAPLAAAICYREIFGNLAGAIRAVNTNVPIIAFTVANWENLRPFCDQLFQDRRIPDSWINGICYHDYDSYAYSYAAGEHSIVRYEAVNKVRALANTYAIKWHRPALVDLPIYLTEWAASYQIDGSEPDELSACAVRMSNMLNQGLYESDWFRWGNDGNHLGCGIFSTGTNLRLRIRAWTILSRGAGWGNGVSAIKPNTIAGNISSPQETAVTGINPAGLPACSVVNNSTAAIKVPVTFNNLPMADGSYKLTTYTADTDAGDGITGATGNITITKGTANTDLTTRRQSGQSVHNWRHGGARSDLPSSLQARRSLPTKASAPSKSKWHASAVLAARLPSISRQRTTRQKPAKISPDTHGTLTWAAGDGTTKTISIPITDTKMSAPKAFTVALSNPTGASLGTVTNQTIILHGSDTNSVIGLCFSHGPGKMDDSEFTASTALTGLGDSAPLEQIQYRVFLRHTPACGFQRRRNRMLRHLPCPHRPALPIRAPGASGIFTTYMDNQSTLTPGYVTFVNIPYTSYDVYVYSEASSAGYINAITLNGTNTYYLKTRGYDWGLDYPVSTATTPEAATGANCVKFTGVSGPNCQISIVAVGAVNGIYHAPLCAVQIVAAKGVKPKK